MQSLIQQVSQHFISLAAVAFVLFQPTVAHAQPNWTFEAVFTDITLRQPVQLLAPPVSESPWFVVEQFGQVTVFQPSEPPSLLTTWQFPDLTKHSLQTGGEQGLLGMAFDPDFENNGWVYFNFTAARPKRTVIARYTVDVNTWQPKANSERTLLEIPQDFANHNGGMLAFGPDGALYIGMGDGGSAGDPNNRAQDGQSLLGKMLRVNRQGQAMPDNPFVNDDSIRDEVWALGLRNPWRFSFDNKTGDLWLADVGQNAYEEINNLKAGGNYGWRWREGMHDYRSAGDVRPKDLIDPVFEYPHSWGQSVTGGVVSRSRHWPDAEGWYLFGDFVSSRLWAMDTATFKVVPQGQVPNPAAMALMPDEHLYVVSYQGRLYRAVDGAR